MSDMAVHRLGGRRVDFEAFVHSVVRHLRVASAVQRHTVQRVEWFELVDVVVHHIDPDAFGEEAFVLQYAAHHQPARDPFGTVAVLHRR